MQQMNKKITFGSFDLFQKIQTKKLHSTDTIRVYEFDVMIIDTLHKITDIHQI